MEKKEKVNSQQLYGYSSQQNEDQGPASEHQSFEAHGTYPYEYNYSFSQQYPQYQQNQYENYSMLSQPLPSYGVTYSPTPQSSSGVTDSLNHPSINTDNTLSDMSYATNNQNRDHLGVFYANSSKETQYDPPFSSEMLKKPFTSNNVGSSINNTSTSFQNELDSRNAFENGHYYFDPSLSFYNEKYASNALSINNSNNEQHLASGVDTNTQKSNVRKENDVFNELLSLAANKKQSSPYLSIIQQQSEIPSEKVKDVHKKTQRKVPTSSNYRNKYKDYSETSSSCALDNLDLVYDLVMIQQPSRARMCGFGDKDRRPISPPPIAKLIVTSKNGKPVSSDTFDISFLVAMCDTWKCGDDSTDANIVKHHGSLSQVITFSNDNESTVNMKNLVGSAAVSATKLYDLEGKLGIFFVFHDISLRTEGSFRLRITLIDIGSSYRHTVNTASTSKTITSIYTDPFVVYTAKKFPGVTDSTPISKCFARQGVKISIRKDSTKNNVKSKTNTE